MPRIRSRRLYFSDPLLDDTYVIQKFKLLKRIKKLWLLDPDTSKFWTPHDVEITDKIDYYDFDTAKILIKFMVAYLSDRYEKQLIEQTISFEELEYFIGCQNIYDVYWDMMDKIKVWRSKYTGIEGKLEFIAKNKQNIHAGAVSKNTDSGVKLLSEFSVPLGQKTLTEIGAAWAPIYSSAKIEPVIADMKYWGFKPTVMSTYKNVYQNVLKGLWAKIKTYKGDTRVELIRRLWEECSESVEMCADGHVGRLVNVLVGFDSDIKVKTKADFQDAISKIAASSLANDAKILEAQKLMDEYSISQDERQVWLDAF